MRILEYPGLDASGLSDSYGRVTQALSRGDFRAAQVKKLTGTDGLYRAKLDHSDRLIFRLVRHRDEVCVLMLEVIRSHDYGKSRFLRGAAVDENKIPDVSIAEASAEALPMRYLHAERTAVHYLDKPLSFDDAQHAIYRVPAPLIIVGGAGSGKTALALEKLKSARGEVLYVTQSAYLARNARDLYYADGFELEDQEATFLSYRELIESIRVPPGREAAWRDFSGWFSRMRQGFKEVETHQAFEEIRGVITAQAGGVLTREQYLALGVRQSIFAPADRERLYDLFEKYRAWLGAEKLFDSSLVAHEWRALAGPHYDFVVIDEVQDLTAAQLSLALKTLKTAGQFLLCGDSNQIVHPNFFSWSRVKSLFWEEPELAARQELHVLATNFRNGSEATRLANTLLKIKHKRFGSIDRESNFLVQSVGAEAGQAVLLPDKEVVKRELDAKIRQSTQFAVLVMREEEKAQARQHFSTPLVFSVQEAKGLEYENIVLYRFVSNQRREFGEVIEGVSREDLTADTLDYARARDKSDKSLEIYKFFVNALYVALTRAVRNLYLVESDVEHPLFALLLLSPGGELKVEARRSSLEEWQKEARKLELQGKQEQADAIRRDILKTTPPPWVVLEEANVRDTLRKVFQEKAPGDKQKQRLYEWAATHDVPLLAAWLAEEAGYRTAEDFDANRVAVARKHLIKYSANYFKDVLRECDTYGVEHRNPANLTPLMAACAAGNLPLVEALLERGADPENTDHFGYNALHHAMLEAFRDPRFANGPFVALFDRVAPACVDVKAGERLVRIDKHISEYFLFQTLWVLFKRRFAEWNGAGFNADSVLAAWQHLPAGVLRPERNRRQSISGVLARNEISREYAYNRSLFIRISHGWYQLNPLLALRRRQGEEEIWEPAFVRLNLPLIKEFAPPNFWPAIDRFLALAKLPECPVPFASERAEVMTRAIERAEAAMRAAEDALDASEEWEDFDEVDEPKWGTPEARIREMARLQRRIDGLRKNKKG